MPENDPEIDKLNELGELVERSQRLKDEARRLLRESMTLDAKIEKLLEASIETARKRGSE